MRSALRLYALPMAVIGGLARLGLVFALAACQHAPAVRRLSAATGPKIDPLVCLLDVRNGPFGFGEVIAVGRLGPTSGPGSIAQLVVPERVLFEFGGDVPPPTAAPIFDALADCLRQADPQTVAAVLGHTDAIGSDVFNNELSRRRARAVIEALVARRIDPQRLLAIAIGSRQPLAPNDTPENRQLNRRVEVLIGSNQQSILQAVATRRSVGDGTPVDVLRPVAGADRITLALVERLGLPPDAQPRSAGQAPSAEVPEPGIDLQMASPNALPRLPDAPFQSAMPAPLPALVPPAKIATPRNLQPAALPTLPKPVKQPVQVIPAPVTPAPLTDYKGD